MSERNRVAPGSTTLAPASAANIAKYNALVAGSSNAAVKAAAYAAVFPGHIKCQQLSGGDGFATMGDGTQMYLFRLRPALRPRQHRARSAGHGAPTTTSTRATWTASGNVLTSSRSARRTVPTTVSTAPSASCPTSSDSKIGSVTLMLDPTTDLPVTGSGYSVSEQVVFTGGGGTGATGHIAALGAGRSIGVRADGVTAAITIDNPGSGYTSPPTVTFGGRRERRAAARESRGDQRADRSRRSAPDHGRRRDERELFRRRRSRSTRTTNCS